MDGNFAMAPKQFEQVYVIRVPIGETAVTVAYCLLEKKDEETYKEMLQVSNLVTTKSVKTISVTCKKK